MDHSEETQQEKRSMVRPILYGACIAVAVVTAISAIGFFI